MPHQIRQVVHLICKCVQASSFLEYPTCPRQALWRCCVPQRMGEGSDARPKPKSTTQKPMSSLATRHLKKIDLARVILRPHFGGNNQSSLKIILNFKFLNYFLTREHLAKRRFLINLPKLNSMLASYLFFHQKSFQYCFLHVSHLDLISKIPLLITQVQFLLKKLTPPSFLTANTNSSSNDPPSMHWINVA